MSASWPGVMIMRRAGARCPARANRGGVALERSPTITAAELLKGRGDRQRHIVRDAPSEHMLAER
jgi:hypothetical protein